MIVLEELLGKLMIFDMYGCFYPYPVRVSPCNSYLNILRFGACCLYGIIRNVFLEVVKIEQTKVSDYQIIHPLTKNESPLPSEINS